MQIGNEVSYNELAGLLGIDRATVARYISLLEKGFVIFHLPPFSRNLRKELGKNLKIYFYRQRYPNTYFWRTYDGKEIDYLEEEGGQLTGFECKLSGEKWRPPHDFIQAYPGSQLYLASRKSYLQYLSLVD